jgi:hypothetical protein
MTSCVDEMTQYVSITGLKTLGPLAVARFWLHAMPAMVQAQSAPGNISAEARTINGVHHTLSVWAHEDALRAYLYTGAHLKAIKAFKSIAIGKTFGFETDIVPSWSEVHELWKQRGQDYA